MVHQRGPKKTGKPLLKPGQRAMIKSERTALRLFGGDLQDAKEEAFIRMVCDGLSLGVSYARAGFTSKASEAARNLFNMPHVQRRAEAVLEARRTQGVVTLPEVTDMLKRVFAGANSEGEYSAAHNAAFSLARLYGHVTDKATLEVLRKPSREPDAPSEQVLGAWVASLPGPTIEAQALPIEPQSLLGGPLSHAPAGLLGLGTAALDGATARPGPQGSGPESFNDFNGLHGAELGRDGPDGTENGAPSSPVTGTPSSGRRSGLLAVSRETKSEPPRPEPPVRNKRVPSGTKRVPAPGGLATPSAKASQKPEQLDRSPPKADGGPVKKRVKSGAEKRKARKLKDEMKALFG